MKFLLLKLGHVKSVIVITLFSVVISVLLTYLILHFSNLDELISIGIRISTVVPLIVAPLVTISLNNLLFQTLALETEMRTLASTDYLTKLLNRREWMIQAERYINLATRNNSSFAILMLDLDDFKAVNDSFGHLVGDEALVLFGEAIKTVCRSSDFYGRFGGEEFIILLPDTSDNQAIQFTERLHQYTRALSIQSGENEVTLTTSIGISVNTPETSFDLDTLISLADNALYQAKNKGKDCTVIFQSTTQKFQNH